MSQPWIGFWLPSRPSGFYTYTKCHVPSIELSDSFRSIQNLTDLHSLLTLPSDETVDSVSDLLDSPTSCYFLKHPQQIKTKTGLLNIFFADQQDCVRWGFRDNDPAVYTDKGIKVANSLPEFLTRVALENAAWYTDKSIMFDQSSTPQRPYSLKLVEFSNQKE